MLTINHDKLTREVARHLEADAVVAGMYWEQTGNAVGGMGCFIGCLAHSDDALVLEERFGLPLMLTKVCEDIFEGLSHYDPASGRDFFAALPDAVGRDGKDLSRVVWQFLHVELRALPPQPADYQALIEPVISGMDLLASGEVWPAAAARAAADAVGPAAAYAAAHAAVYAAADGYADAAACSAAYAVGYAARSAAHAVARKRQAQTILQLIREA